MKNPITKLTQGAAYGLALEWMPQIRKDLGTQWEIENLAEKIWHGDFTQSDAMKLRKEVHGS
jgi:hypothetical protein